MNATPTPGDLSARLLDLANEISTAMGPSTWARKLCDLAALSALPAAGGEVAWPTEAKRAGDDWQARTALSTHTMGEAQAAVWNACRAACIAAHKRAATTPQPSAAEEVEWDGATRTMQEHLYLMTGERDRYKALHEQAEPTIARMERRIAEMEAAVGAQGDDGPDTFDCEHAHAARMCGCGFCRALNAAAPAAGKGVDAVRKAIEAVPPGYFNPTGGHTQAENRAAVVDLVTAALTRQPVAGDGVYAGIPLKEAIATGRRYARENDKERPRLAQVLESLALAAERLAAPAATPTDGGEECARNCDCVGACKLDRSRP